MRRILITLAVVAGVVVGGLPAVNASAAATTTGDPNPPVVLTPVPDVPGADMSIEHRAANLAKRTMTRDQLPKAPTLLSDARPYGGERMGIEIPSTTINGWTTFCTSAYGALSSTGGKYYLTAGHCIRDNSNQTNGRFFYPVCGGTHQNCPYPVNFFGDTGARWNFTNTSTWNGGDFAAVRANLLSSGVTPTRKLRQPENGRIDTMTSAGDPVLGADVSVYAGNSQKVYKGFYAYVDDFVGPYADGTFASNIAWIQAPASDGCPVGGDSGSPTATGLVFNGIVSGSGVQGDICWIDVTQAGTAMTKYGLHSAPANG